MATYFNKEWLKQNNTKTGELKMMIENLQSVEFAVIRKTDLLCHIWEKELW